jgi:hypothetical protein
MNDTYLGVRVTADAILVVDRGDVVETVPATGRVVLVRVRRVPSGPTAPIAVAALLGNAALVAGWGLMGGQPVAAATSAVFLVGIAGALVVQALRWDWVLMVDTASGQRRVVFEGATSPEGLAAFRVGAARALGERFVVEGETS